MIIKNSKAKTGLLCIKKITGTTNNNSKLNAEIVVPLKYLSNFWRSLDLPLINCEIEHDLTWSKYCVI